MFSKPLSVYILYYIVSVWELLFPCMKIFQLHCQKDLSVIKNSLKH